jgi:hypothetical protein
MEEQNSSSEKENTNLKLEAAKTACRKECTKKDSRKRKNNRNFPEVKLEYTECFKDCMKGKMHEP